MSVAVRLGRVVAATVVVVVVVVPDCATGPLSSRTQARSNRARRMSRARKHLNAL
jgi:hypothetical protein